MAANIVERRVSVGDSVRSGQVVFVLSAMKMETLVTSPSDGVIAAICDVAVGEPVGHGQALVALTPGQVDGATATAIGHATPDATWAATLDDVTSLQQLALGRLAPRRRNRVSCDNAIAAS